MKLLQVLFSGLGGHGSVAFSLVRGDRARQHRHAMIFFGIEPLAPGYAASCAELGVDYQVIQKVPGLDLRSWSAFVRALRLAAPDVVVLHSMSLVVPAASYRALGGTPIIAVDHLSNQVKRPRDWVFTALSLGLTDRLVVLTETFAREVKGRLGPLARRDRMVVIGNGIDLASFAPGGGGRAGPARALRVGMHGRFTESKDHATLVRAIARLRDLDGSRTQAPEVHLALAGDGETHASVAALIRQLGLEQQVELHGMLPEADVPRYLRSLDLYVQASHGEAMSTAVMQAMATGLPVIASDVPGLRDMVRHGETGLLFADGDVEALANLLDRLRRDADQRKRLAEMGRMHALERWSQEAMFEAYAALAGSLIQR